MKGAKLMFKTMNDIKPILIQWFFFITFLFFFVFNEKYSISVLQDITTVPFYTVETHASMAASAPLFLPGSYWLMVFPLIFIALALFSPLRIRFIVLFGLGLCYLLLLIGNELYYQFFSTAITLSSFKSLYQLPQVSSSVFAALKVWQYVRILFYLFFFGVPIFLFRKKLDRSRRVIASDIILAIFLAMLSGRIFLIVQKEAEFKDAPRKGSTILMPGFATSKRDYAITFGMGNLILDALTTQPDFENDRPLARTELNFVMNNFYRRYQMNQEKSPLYGVAEGKNVVLISMESFQHFLVNMKCGDWEVTPNLNRLANQGLNFNYVFDNIVRGGSSDAEFMAMTGLLADVDNISVFEYPQTMQLLYLPQTLKEHGYDTASFHGNSGDFYDRIHNHPIYGFNHSFFIQDYTQDVFHMGISDRTFFLETADKLISLKQPFLAYLITLSSHHPFQSPPGTEEIDTGFPPDSEVASYLHSVHYADSALGLFLDKMKKKGLYNNSIFIVFGDHMPPMSTESRDLIERKRGYNPGHPQEIRIAFTIFMPGASEKFQTVYPDFKHSFSGLQDLFPTVLHLIGEEVPFGVFGTHMFLSPEDKGPELFWRVQNGFGYESRIYECDSESCHSIFSFSDHYPELSEEKAANVGMVTKDYFYLHRYIYEQNAQETARAAFTVAPETNSLQDHR